MALRSSPQPSSHAKLSRLSHRATPPHRTLRRRSPLVLFLLLLLWSVILGWGLAQATTAPQGSQGRAIAPTQALATQALIAQTTAPNSSPVTAPDQSGLVDIVPAEFQMGQELYLQNCATCHVGLPPAVMPTDSWKKILTQPTHYGVEITPFQSPTLQAVWNYVSTYSRPLKKDEPVPFRLRSSRFFKVLHPDVEFSEPISVNSCVTCHPAAAQFNYRSLTSQWQETP